MKYDEFVKHVQAVAQTNSLDDAERAIQATLETLAQRIHSDEAHHLAAQLPEEMSPYLRNRQGESGESFSLKEFYQRVADQEGIDGPTAATHVNAIFTVLVQAVTAGEFAGIRAKLSNDYEELFAAKMPK